MLPFLYSTIMFCGWFAWDGWPQQFSDTLIGLLILNLAIGVLMISVFMENRSKK
ncbi:MAG: hypothetical protein ABIK92_04800 [Pseudomonadota bacterium]